MNDNKSISDAFENVIDYFLKAETWIHIGSVVLEIVFIYLAGRIAKKIAVRAVEHMFRERQRNPLKFDPRRAATIGKLTRNIVSYAINFIVILMILSQLGIQLGPLLAGAGVVGLAIGFGAQNLVKDVISGFFIIFEDQFGVGDVIQTGNVKGTVEEIGLRVTRLKIWTGEVHIIPNGTIGEVTNFSLNHSVAVVDVSIAYEEDVDKAIEVIQQAAMNVYNENDNIIKEPDVLGVQSMGATGVTIRVTCECKNNTHFGAARVLNKALKNSLDAAGIKAPYPRMITYQRSEKVEA